MELLYTIDLYSFSADLDVLNSSCISVSLKKLRATSFQTELPLLA